jgi:translation initiation factor IF-3
VRLISDGGEQLGIVSRGDALNRAYERGLDLVLISPKAEPPVAKIMDYGKYNYENKKHEKEVKKKQKTMQTKEIRLSTFIESHDMVVKAKSARKFLEAGDSVKVTLRFRGREQGFVDQGKSNLAEFAKLLEDISKVGKDMQLEGRNLSMTLAPTQKK